MGSWMSWSVVFHFATVSFMLVHGYDDEGFDGWYQPVPHRPVDIITDVINDLGVRILQQYTAHGNVAFSPTGVGFVLAALYEGSAGKGRQQISDSLGLPRDPDITRIGYRDIHRRLRTYLNADGFLGGLTLNQENTRLRPEYEDILRFYGFDLSVPEEKNDTGPATLSPESTTMVTEEPINDTRTTIVPEETTVPITTGQASETTMETSTEETLDATRNTLNGQDRMTQTTSESSVSTSDTINPVITTITSSTEAPSISVSTTMSSPTTQSKTTPFATSISQSSSIAEATTNSIIVSSIPTTPGTSTMEETSESVSGMNVTISESNMFETSTEPRTSTTIDTSIVTTITMIPINVTTGETSSTTQANNMSIFSTNGPSVDENTVSTDSTNDQSDPGQVGSTESPVTTVASEDETGSTGQSISETTTANGTANRRKRSLRSPRGFFSSYPDEGIWMQDLGIWKPYSPNLNEASVRDSTEISFLVNGCDVSSVTASRYVAVLPFAYFPSLHAVALEFPLDDPRYNILLMMATDRRDTYKLARDLGGKSLRILRKQLQSTWVRATIPSFMLRGFVTLTSFLQRLGIVDVFEPRVADLSPMTPDLGVYARDVQQSIGVNIRNYMKPDRTHSRNGLFERAGPVPFTVVQPFLYFIVDAETSVTLIAGRVNDPLNSRIL